MAIRSLSHPGELPAPDMQPGTRLRRSRERLGLTMREVESASFRIAERHGNDEFAVCPSRLSDIETKGLVPSIYRLYSLSNIASILALASYPFLIEPLLTLSAQRTLWSAVYVVYASCCAWCAWSNRQTKAFDTSTTTAVSWSDLYQGGGGTECRCRSAQGGTVGRPSSEDRCRSVQSGNAPRPDSKGACRGSRRAGCIGSGGGLRAKADLFFTPPGTRTPITALLAAEKSPFERHIRPQLC